MVPVADRGDWALHRHMGVMPPNAPPRSPMQRETRTVCWSIPRSLPTSRGRPRSGSCSRSSTTPRHAARWSMSCRSRRATRTAMVTASSKSRSATSTGGSRRSSLPPRFRSCPGTPIIRAIPRSGRRAISSRSSSRCIEQHYPARADRDGRLLVGFSKSGWGAYSLLLRHPDRFGKAAAWDAPLMEERAGPLRHGPDLRNAGELRAVPGHGIARSPCLRPARGTA